MSLTESMRAMLATVPFDQAIWLFPLAVLFHVVDEWPGFPQWARRFASRDYSDREYLVVHAAAIVAALVAVATLHVWPMPWLVFAFFAIAFFPAVFCNAVFHIGAALLTRTHCSGVVTSTFVYLPLCAFLVVLALIQGVTTPGELLVALAVAAPFHTWEVGHTVFKRW